MANKINVKLILELRDANMSRNRIVFMFCKVISTKDKKTPLPISL